MSKATAEQTAENTKQVLVMADDKSLETVTAIAEKFGMSRKQLYEWIKTDKEFARAFYLAREATLDEQIEESVKQLKEWGDNPEKKVGMVNFLAKMAWLKAHDPVKWNEKSFSKIEKTEKKITTIEVRLPSQINNPVEAQAIQEAGRELKINLLNEGVNDDGDTA
jgi:predicted DNA-binding transcriptional regulator AlpA